MIQFLPRRFPGRGRRFDSAADLLPRGVGLGAFPVYGLPSTVYRPRGLGSTAPSALAAAIAKAEGANASTNNPGNLEFGDIGYGVWSAAGGQKITIFPTADAGWAALQNQINKISSGTSTAGYTPDMSIAQVGSIYSGSTNGNWANNVAAALGVSPDANFAAQASNPGTPSPSAVPDASSPTDSTGIDLSSLLTSDNAPYLAAGAVALAALAWAMS